MQAIGVPFRCMMIQGCAPEQDVPYALRHANVIRNNSPTNANKGWTPKEKELGLRLPPNKHLLKGPLFCLVFAHVYEEERVKHAPRGIPCVYLGYNDVDNVYIVKEWVSRKTYYTADVTFISVLFLTGPIQTALKNGFMSLTLLHLMCLLTSLLLVWMCR